MRWKQGRRSEHVDDRRGLRMGRAGRPSGVILIVVVVAALVFKLDPSALLSLAGDLEVGGPAVEATAEPRSAAEDGLADFVSVVLADTEDVWRELFAADGRTYPEPTLVLFTGAVSSACGAADAAVGPFYCPGDDTVYLDLSFFDELARRHGAPGDFAAAYVIAHEIGHHVQNTLGTMDALRQRQQGLGRSEANDQSVRLELQADFYAGVWAHHAQRMRQVLEPGDIEEALAAASAVGDDTLQRQATGRVMPDAFTHGSAAQRSRWFRRGFESGDLSQGDTFSVSDP